jgi:hypothetical protein
MDYVPGQATANAILAAGLRTLKISRRLLLAKEPIAPNRQMTLSNVRVKRQFIGWGDFETCMSQ